jgi:septal ring-binding cell division protein DamX
MSQPGKVYVFERKEVFLILVFALITSVVCFTLGVNLGKKLAFEKAGILPEDQKIVEFRSTEEEDADETVQKDNLTEEEKLSKMMESSKEKLNQELQKFSQDSNSTSPEVAQNSDVASTTPLMDQYRGKFTIQLGSYDKLEDAKNFAEGFTIRGYNPIIYESEIDKRKWYRVSLGAFENAEKARAYVNEQQSLFSGQEFVITEFK